MRNHVGLLIALAACSSGDKLVNDGAPTTVHLTMPAEPGLVMFKDGPAAPWQPATQVSPMAYDAVVHGPYVATVICLVSNPSSDPAAIWETWQRARVPEDPTDLVFKCGPTPADPTRYRVHGHVAQASRILIGDTTAEVQADSDFSLQVIAGTYDLYALTNDAIAVRRAITVGGATEVTPAIDIVAEGDALVDTPLSTNGYVEVSLASSPGSFQSAFTTGPAATAKVAPLRIVGSRDAQRVSVSASSSYRSVSRPFVAGDDPTFQLPPPLDVHWSSGQLAAPLAAVAAEETITLAVSNGSFARPTYYELEMTSRFRAETGATHAALDLEIPGVQTAWQMEPYAYSSRWLQATQTVDGATSSRSCSDSSRCR